MKYIILLITLFAGINLYAGESNTIESFLAIIKNDPGDYRAYNKLAVLYNEQGEALKAEKNFINAIVLNNNYYEGFFNLGLFYYQQQKYQESLHNLKRAYIIIAESPDLYINLIHSSLKLGQLTLAKDYLNKALEKFKKPDYKLLNCSGVVEMMYKDYAKAKEYFSKALEIQADNGIKNNLAIAEYKLGNTARAKELLDSIGKSTEIISENYKLIK